MTCHDDCAFRDCVACDALTCVDHDAACPTCGLALTRCTACRSLAVDVAHVARELGYGAGDATALATLLRDAGLTTLDTRGVCAECCASARAA